MRLNNESTGKASENNLENQMVAVTRWDRILQGHKLMGLVILQASTPPPIVPFKSIENGVYGDLIIIYPKPYSIYLRGTIDEHGLTYERSHLGDSDFRVRVYGAWRCYYQYLQVLREIV